MPINYSHLLTPDDLLLRAQQKAMVGNQMIGLPDGSQMRYGDRNPIIAPPTQAPTQPAQPHSIPGLPQLSQLSQGIPMPGQLGDAAKQSSLFGNNWASMFG